MHRSCGLLFLLSSLAAALPAFFPPLHRGDTHDFTKPHIRSNPLNATELSDGIKAVVLPVTGGPIDVLRRNNDDDSPLYSVNVIIENIETIEEDKSRKEVQPEILPRDVELIESPAAALGAAKEVMEVAKESGVLEKLAAKNHMKRAENVEDEVKTLADPAMPTVEELAFQGSLSPEKLETMAGAYEASLDKVKTNEDDLTHVPTLNKFAKVARQEPSNPSAIFNDPSTLETFMNAAMASIQASDAFSSDTLSDMEVISQTLETSISRTARSGKCSQIIYQAFNMAFVSSITEIAFSEQGGRCLDEKTKAMMNAIADSFAQIGEVDSVYLTEMAALINLFSQANQNESAPRESSTDNSLVERSAAEVGSHALRQISNSDIHNTGAASGASAVLGSSGGFGSETKGEEGTGTEYRVGHRFGGNVGAGAGA